MTTRARAFEEERRKCRWRWVACRRAWRMWSYNLKVAAAPPKEKQQRAEIERCKLELANERNEMRLVAAARVGIAALETRAAENSPVQRMVGRRKLEPRVSEAKRWAVEGTCFGLNWIEVERASHATKKAALADMRAIAKKMPHLQLRVVEVVERRDVIARSGAKPPNDEAQGMHRERAPKRD